MIRVYCDTGAFVSALTRLESEGHISLHQFKYENRSKRIRGIALPSALTYDELKNYAYDELEELTYSELGGANSKLEDIVAIVGACNRMDARHLDSAQMSGCSVFLTSDKNDIWSKRNTLKAVAGLTVFHVPTELEQFVALVKNDGS